MNDFRHALRLFRRTPALTFVSVLSLALTIGTTAVVFTAFKAVLLNPLPYSRPEELLLLSSGGAAAHWVSWSDMQDVARRNRSFQSVATYHYSLLNLKGDGSNPPQALYGLRVSANLFRTLGVAPLIGRDILPQEDQPGRNHQIILSYGLWKSRFAADANVLGRTLSGNGIDYTVIGVMPPGFDFPLRLATTVRTPAPYMEFWTPEGQDPAKDDRNGTGFAAIARLRPGVTPGQAVQDLGSIARDLEREYPRSNKDRRIDALPLEPYTLGNSRPALLILMAAAALFMLIGCSNVANLLLSLSVARRREIGMRLALGAPRARIVRQLMSESAVLALAGGVCAWMLTEVAWTLLPAIVPQNIPRLITASVDWRVFAFTLAVALANGMLFGIVPALRATYHVSADALRESGGRGSIGPGRNRMRFGIVSAEIALTLVLVVAGVQLASAFVRTMRRGVGFEPDHVLASIIVPLGPQYTGNNGSDPDARSVFWRKVLDGARQLPGVESAGAVDALPFSGQNHGAYAGTADRAYASHTSENVAEFDKVSANYLQTMGVQLLAGRWLTDADENNPVPAIIDQNAAQRFFPGRDPLGQRICIDCTAGEPPNWKQVVGVVSAIHHHSLEAASEPQIYSAEGALRNAQFLVMQVRGRTFDVAAPLRRMVAGIDAGVPIYLSEDMAGLIADSVGEGRFVMAGLAITALLALMLAAAGVYSVVSWAASQRTREIGIRVALGPTRSDIEALIVGEGLKMVATGVGIGIIGALAITRLLHGLLEELNATDPLSIAVASGAVTLIALLATFVPARRATRLDPMAALRQE